MTPQQHRLFRAAESAMDEFVRAGNLEPSDVKQVHPRPQVDQVEWAFSVPSGSFLGMLYGLQRDGDLLPAINVEVAIAKLEVGCRRKALLWAMRENWRLDGLVRLALNDDLMVVSIGAVVTADNLDYVAASISRLPSAAQSLLARLEATCAVRPFPHEQLVLHG
jgi:hypothetical protein